MTQRTVDVWFDPMCPYTWIISRWLLEVQQVRPVAVRWHVLSLAVLNEDREEDPEGDPDGFLWMPVRLCAAVARKYGQEALGRLYTALGTRVHNQGEQRDDTFQNALSDAGLPRELAAVADSTEYDDAVRASHAEGLGLVGDHVGSPVLACTDEEGRRIAFFGPVLSTMPRGEQAARLWDGVLLVAGTPGFHELKGGPHEEPNLADLR
ncbi:Predicted dithiol-disulfide isomerase, DsbA family [Amycolatopsis marina]|uniref:Predicted dithiol-disulfide isomerase, DsbA family n=1 Tax=Amycolatopsis marina TaxID=490629 RepID=A0A1I0ZRS1_9PSEU|nr:disulfide bond formation protein DsbA [Amycolatopsis marina]SFB26853.1 Predicted dithiol-disulfide isomerase, DsbA family [Amycolatopsis marina]